MSTHYRPRTSMQSHRSQPTSSPLGMWADIPQVVDDSADANHLVVPKSNPSPWQSPSGRSLNGSLFAKSSPGLTFDSRTIISSVDGDEYDPGSWASEDPQEPRDDGLGLATGHPWYEPVDIRSQSQDKIPQIPFSSFGDANGPEPDPGYGLDATSAVANAAYFKASKSNAKDGKIKNMLKRVSKALAPN